MKASSWAEDEAAGADFGDHRLNVRFAMTLHTLGENPNLSIPAACGGRAEMVATYRLCENEKVTFDKVIAPHNTSTEARLAKQEVVLLVQDTTEIDLTRPEMVVKGAGDLDGVRRGVFLHLAHGFTTDGTPLGTLYAQMLNRAEVVSQVPAAEKAKKKRTQKQTPIEEKESLRWLKGFREGQEVAKRLPNVTFVNIADSESDIYEVLSEPRSTQNLHFLIRACQDRALSGDSKEFMHLRESVLGNPALYQDQLTIRARKAKTTVERRVRRQNREGRTANLEVRAAAVTLRPPWRPRGKKLPLVQVNAVIAHEPNPPEGEPPVEWILLTTLPIDTLEQVRTIVNYYCVRWSIELLFRTLKSGCRVEKRRFEHIDHLLPCLGLYLIVAWRTLFVCRLARSCPDKNCQEIFEPSEWKAVWTVVNQEKPPTKIPRLRAMVHLIASLGGYVERRGSEPGTQTLWIGLQRMHDLAWAWDAFGPGANTGG